MKTKKKKKIEIAPIVSSSHMKEDDSRMLFHEAIKPWMIINWFVKDYGIDANIEISRFLSSGEEQIATGKRFSLQLKSTTTSNFSKKTFSLSVPRDKITYWYNSLEPVMLAYADLTDKKIFYRWVDENFIQQLNHQNPNWLAQETISVRFEKNKLISKGTLTEIERYVFQWKRPLKSILTPGNYFKFSVEAKSISDKLNTAVKENNIVFLQEDLEMLKSELSKSIYTITVVGPNRVGKSTLINSLLYKKVSPVDILPTTGIPISFYPSNEDKTTISFFDKEPREGGVDDKFLNEYTSQQHNFKNTKKVKYVSVNIINHMLEKGLALCDVPGLDDANEEIRRITKAAVYSGNAIIYVISVAPFLNGEFSINKQIVDDLNTIGGLMDRIFLVFNKIDKLNEEQQKVVKKYINEQLEEYGILKFLPSPPLFISSENSFQFRVLKVDKEDSVVELEKHIWEYLLNQNKTGLHKILSAFANCKALIDKYRHVIGARLIASDKRQGIEKEILEVRSEVSNLRSFVANERQQIFESLKEYTSNSFQNILAHLETQLSSTPPNEKLPGKPKILSYLENYAYQVISNVNNELQQEVYEFQSSMNKWIEERLKQVEISLDSQTDNVDLQMPDVTKYTNQIFSFFQESRGGYMGILEQLFGGMVNFLEWLFENIDRAFTANEKLRDRDVKSIMSKATRAYKKIETDFLPALNKYLNTVCRRMEENSIDRTNVYLGTLSAQLKELDIPLQPFQKDSFEGFLSQVTAIEMEVESCFTQLKDYTDSIEWVKQPVEKAIQPAIA